MSARRRSPLRLALLLAALVVLAALFTRTFLFRVYRVDSGSMEPYLFGSPERGESVLVKFDSELPPRFAAVVLRRREGAVVKRVIGLPGETVEIRGGDILIDGARLSLAMPRPSLVTVFDSRAQAIAEHFTLGSRDERPWSAGDDGVWLLDASTIPRGAQDGLLYLTRNVTDDYLDPDGRLVAGLRVVNDLAVRARLRVTEARPDGLLHFGLSERGDLFEALLEPSAGGGWRAHLARRNCPDRREELATLELPDIVGRRLLVEFRNVDDQLRLTLALDDAEPLVLQASYSGNEFHPGDTLREGKSFAPRVQLGGEGLRLALSDLAVARDLFYTPRDRYGVEEPCILGVDEIFVLGDNSANSQDSRLFGPVPLHEIVGRPFAVLWPWADRRRLAPPH